MYSLYLYISKYSVYLYLFSCPLARATVALPRAKPMPRPRTALDRNIGAFLPH